METRTAAFILGVGRTDFSRRSGRSTASLAVEAVESALNRAGLEPEAVEGLIPFQDGGTSEDVISGVGIPSPRFLAISPLGGAAPVAGLGLAASAISAGNANCVVIFVARNGSSGSRIVERARGILPSPHIRELLEWPHGVNTPGQLYAFAARRHMIQYGTTREQLGDVAVTMRSNASHNPRAQMADRPLDLNTYLDSRVIFDPFLLYDCCLESDGAVAIIVGSEALTQFQVGPKVRIAGVGIGRPPRPEDLVNRADINDSGAKSAVNRAMKESKLDRDDMDMAFLYDCFTFEVIHQLEAAGFCAVGEGGPFVESGAIRADGAIPVNPHGGLLSEAHIAGANHIAEAFDQIRGESEGIQILKAETALVVGWGDLGDASASVLVRD